MGDDKDDRDDRDDRGDDGDDDRGDRGGDGKGNGASKRERDLSAEASRYRRRARDAESKLDELQRQLDEVKQGKGDDSERVAAAAVRKREDELKHEHAREVARLRVEVIAAGKLRNVDDVKLLDLDDLADLADDPRALKRAAEDAVAQLLEDRPYLAREGGDGDDDGDGDGDRSRNGDGDRDRSRDLGDVVSPGRRGDDRGADGKRSKGDDGNAWLRDAGRKA